MRLLIALAVFVCRWWMVCGRCSFPGITARAEFRNSSIHWQSSFQEGDVIQYECPFQLWPLFPDSKLKLTCRSDGTWDKPLPGCGEPMSMLRRTLAVKYGPKSLPWKESCSSRQSSNIYSIKIPKEFKYITFLMINFCGSDTIYVSPGGDRQMSMNAFYNSSLDQVGACNFSTPDNTTITYTCNKFVSLDEIEHQITIHMKEKIPLFDIAVQLVNSSGNQCGRPPVPFHAFVATDVMPGTTTNVTYKCSDPFVMDSNGPQFSTCDQLTGQWTALPKCISAVPSGVPVKLKRKMNG